MNGETESWARASAKTLVKAHLMGPFQLTYVNPKDTPAAAKTGQ